MSKTRPFLLFFLLIFTFFLHAQENRSVEISVKTVPEVLTPGATGKLYVSFTFPEGFHQTKSPDFFFIGPGDGETGKYITVEAIEYPPGTEEDGLLNYYGTVTLSADITVSADAPDEYKPEIKAGWQICSDSGTCFFPEEKNIILSIQETSENSSADLILLLKFILFAFIGGLLLNVMPCVLPILSMRALNLINQSGNDKRTIFKNALLYGAGVLISLIILAVIVIILKLTGQMAGWGFQFQNPVFVSVLMVTIFIFALSLFDLFLINPPGLSAMARAASKKGYIGSFFNGIFAVLLATPCTAPFLGAALGFAFSQSPLFILVSFSAIGAGFALPFILLGIWPAAIQALPKPGKWMDTFKEMMGFLLLGTVVYLFSTLRYEVDSDGQMKVIIYLLAAAFIAWIYGKLSNPSSKIRAPKTALAVSLLLLVGSGLYFLDFRETELSPVSGSVSEASGVKDGWETFAPDTLEQYLDQGKAVLVQFSAKWCTVCKVNDRVIFNSEKGKTFFKDRNIILLYGDYTKRDPLIGNWIRKYGKAGVPVYAYYSPGSREFTVLPEILTWSIIEETVSQKKIKKLDGGGFLSKP